MLSENKWPGSTVMAERIYTLIEIGNIILCLHFLFGKKIRINFPTLMLVCIDTLLFELIHEYGAHPIVSCMMYLVILVYTIIEFGYDRKSLILGNALYIIVIGIMQLGMGMVILLLPLKALPDSLILLLIHILVSGCLILSKNILLKLLNLMRRKNWIVFAGGIFWFGILAGSILRYKKEMRMTATWGIFLFITGSLICVLSYFWQKEKEKSYRQEMDLKIHELYDPLFKEMLDALRCKQHEFNNHMQAINGMHYTISTYEELVEAQKKYCREYEKDNDFSRLLGSNWAVLSGFLYSKFMEAKKRGIRIIQKVCVSGPVEGIPEFIMIEILGILLDNAMEEVEGKKHPVIYVDIYEEEGLMVNICNPAPEITYACLPRLFEKGYSSKNGHMGLGLYKIAEYGIRYGFEPKAMKMEYRGDDCLVIILKIG